MELIKHLFQYKKDGFVMCLLFTVVMLPNVLPAVMSPTELPTDIGEPSSAGLLPCSFESRILLHGEEETIDACTTCRCDNGVVKCSLKSCPFLPCKGSVKLEGECCRVCEYYVPIYKTNAGNLNDITEREVNNVTFDLNLKIHGHGVNVAGQGLWKLSIWGSRSGDGAGERISYQKQVLTDEQAATSLIRPEYFGGFDFNISNIVYSLDGSGAACSEMEFLCYEFNKGDNPELLEPRLPFTVEGVAEEDDLTIDTVPQPENLRGCTRFPDCFRRCWYGGGNVYILHGEEYIEDECSTVTCNNGKATYTHRTCEPRASCYYPVKFEGDCCESCPYYVPIREVNVENLNNTTEGVVNDITFDLNLKIRIDGDDAFGQGLWKLSLWGSGSADGEGKRISYQEQVLTEEQAATKLVKPGFYRDYELDINNIAYSLNGTSASCSEMEFLCYEFNKGDNPVLKDPRLNFTVEGVAGYGDSTPAPQNLGGCTRLSTCVTEGANLQPCYNGGNVIPHGGEYIQDECSTVTCNNSIATVAIRRCPNLWCDSPVKFESECCEVCPYYVPIYEINTGELNPIAEQKVNDIVFDLNLRIHSDAVNVIGQGLWKLGIWGSGSSDGEGERISFQEQVLTVKQAAIQLIKPSHFKSFDFNISNITYSLDGTDGTCSEMEFLCYEFNKGDNPNLKDPRLNFTVEGVAGEDDLTPAPQNLRGCTRISTCVEEGEDLLPCSYRGNIIHHGASYSFDACSTVDCDNGVVKIAIFSCPPIFCYLQPVHSPVKFEGECCEVCPYYVPIYLVNLENLKAVTEGRVNDIVFDLNLKIHDSAVTVIGQGLWKLSIWGSSSADGEGERISYQEQVLTEESASTNLLKPKRFSNFDFNISNITYVLDGTDATCSEMEFLCYEFDKGDNPQLKDPRLNFTVEGVAETDDLIITDIPRPQNLRGCTRFSTCVSDTSMTDSTVQACENIPAGQEDDFLFDIRVAVRSAGINERGEKSWNVNVLGVNVVTSGDKD